MKGKEVHKHHMKKAKEAHMHHIDKRLAKHCRSLWQDTCKHASNGGKRHRLHTLITDMHQVCEEDVHMLAASGFVVQHPQSAFHILPVRLQTIHGTACKSLQLCSVLMDLPRQLRVLTHPCRSRIADQRSSSIKTNQS